MIFGYLQNLDLWTSRYQWAKDSVFFSRFGMKLMYVEGLNILVWNRICIPSGLEFGMFILYDIFPRIREFQALLKCLLKQKPSFLVNWGDEH